MVIPAEHTYDVTGSDPKGLHIEVLFRKLKSSVIVFCLKEVCLDHYKDCI